MLLALCTLSLYSVLPLFTLCSVHVVMVTCSSVMATFLLVLTLYLGLCMCSLLLTARSVVFILCSVPIVSLLLWDVLLPLYTLCLAPDLVVSCSPLGLSCALMFVPCCIIYWLLFIPFPITLVPCPLPIFQCPLRLVSTRPKGSEGVYNLRSLCGNTMLLCGFKNFLIRKFLEAGQRPHSSSICTLCFDKPYLYAPLPPAHTLLM